MDESMREDASTCLDELTALELVERRLDADARQRWDAHLDRCPDCRRLVAALAPEPAPPRITLQRCLGRGGFGSVFAAWDRTLERPIAIKLLDDADADAEATIRREARALARLSDPHVVAIYDVGRLDDQLFIAMELMDGGSLGRWLATDPEPEAIVDAFAQAAAGLDAAHRAGIVHGDFKADNVLRTKSGRIAVADFGLARAVRDSTTDGDDGRSTVAGTPSHLAPEVARGASKSPRTDQYAFGVALGDALRGRGGRRILRVVARARAEDPRRRFESMSTVLRALDPVGRSRPGKVLPWLFGAVAAIGFVAVAHSTGPNPLSTTIEPDPVRELRCDTLGDGHDEAVDPSWERALDDTHRELRFESGHGVIGELERLANQASTHGWPCAEGRARMLLGAAQSSQGDPVSAGNSFAAAALLGESLDFDLMVVRGWTRAVGQALLAGNLEAAHEQLRHASAYGERRSFAPELAAAIDVARGRVAKAEGRYDDAIEHFERALEGGLESTDRAHARTSLAAAMLRLDRVDEAAEQAATALRELDAIVPGARDRIEVLDLLTRIATQRGQHDEAVRYATDLLDALALADMGDSLNFAVALNVRGVALTQQGAYEAARSDLDRARRRYEALLGPEAPTTGNAWYALGQLEKLSGNPRLAVAHLERALPLAEASGNSHFVSTVSEELTEARKLRDGVSRTR